MKQTIAQKDPALNGHNINQLDMEEKYNLKKNLEKTLAAANRVQLLTCWKIGKAVEEKLKPKEVWSRSVYDKAFKIAQIETEGFGFVYSKRDVYFYWKFYKTFPDPDQIDIAGGKLGWPYFRHLLRISNPETRLWYLRQAKEENWSVKTLDHAISTQYVQRLSLSNDPKAVKAELMEKTARFHEKPSKLVEAALLAEFFGVGTYFMYETKLESVLLDQICQYLLTLKGFVFVERQKHIMTETEDYYIDLVFYHTDLRRFILIDLVAGKIIHQHPGQMHMYVNMFDHLEKGKDDQPTIGLILGSELDQESFQYSFIQDSDQLFIALLTDFEGLRKAVEKGKQRALMEMKD